MMRKEQIYVGLEWKNTWKNIKKMAHVSYNKLWESDFDKIVSKRGKPQDLFINQLKLQLQDIYKEDDKIKTNFEPTDDS